MFLQLLNPALFVTVLTRYFTITTSIANCDKP